jgi:hypothetical protein
MLKNSNNTETKARTSRGFFELIEGKANPEERFIAETSVSPLHSECSNSAENHINSAENHIQTKIPVPSIIEVVVKEPRSKEQNLSMAGSLFAEHKLADKMTEPLTHIATESMGDAEVYPAISKGKDFDLLVDGCEPSNRESLIASPSPLLKSWEVTPSSLHVLRIFGSFTLGWWQKKVGWHHPPNRTLRSEPFSAWIETIGALHE